MAVTAEVSAASNQKATAASKWESKNAGHFGTVRDTLRSMAGGRERCMYCEDSYATDIEHFRPKGDFPLHAFAWGNYLLACSHCNSNQKRTKFPLDSSGDPLLIDPSSDDPADHLAYLPDCGEFVGKTNRGLESIEIYGLNRPVLVQGRVDAWVAATALVVQYADAVSRGDSASAASFHTTLGRSSFGFVLDVMFRYATGAVTLLDESTRQALCNHPELIP